MSRCTHERSNPPVLSVSSGPTPSSKERVLLLLRNERWDELHLRLPKDWEDAIEALRQGCDPEYVVEEMNDLGQIRLPEDRYILRSWIPFLEGLWEMAGDKEVHCFRDPLAFSHQRQISLELATESLKAKIGLIDIKAWKDLILEDAHLAAEESRREAEGLARSVRGEAVCVDLSVDAERILSESGFELVRVDLSAGGAPLAKLKGKVLLLESEEGGVPDEVIELGVREHLQFLDVLMSSESLEEACLKWASMTKEHPNGS